MTRRLAAALLAAAVLAAGCGDDGGDDGLPAAEAGGAPVEVAACDDLRRRENELIAAVNEALSELGRADDDQARARAVDRGFSALVALVRAQEVGDVEPALRDVLVEGASRAAAELEDEHARFLADHPTAVSAADERGVAGQLQNALEKAFSHLEPPRSAYRDVGLAEATDADPDCRFVSQRGDPAG